MILEKNIKGVFFKEYEVPYASLKSNQIICLYQSFIAI